MSFLHPEFLWLIPLIALPIIIHLLTRLRYRRVRWAAIDFLIHSERKAVRRARLQQILLMILRTLVLAFALLALLEPILRGAIGRLLGGGNKVVILLDGSASMSSATASGSAFDRAKQAAGNALDSFPRGAAAAFGLMAGETQIASRAAVHDLQTVKDAVARAKDTDGAANVPQAIRQAAETLQRSGGGGVIWILTDGQASDWHAMDSGEWEATRKTLELAGKPQIVVTPFERSPGVNFSVAGIALSPPIPVEGDSPRLTATVQIHSPALRSPAAAAGAEEPPEAAKTTLANVSLYFDGERVDSSSVNFSRERPAGKADCVFRLPRLKSGDHSGWLQLDPDAIAADNRYYFTINTEERVPVLIVQYGRANKTAIDLRAPDDSAEGAASHLLALALKPPEAEGGYRSPFQPKVIAPAGLDSAVLDPYAAVFLNEPPALPDAAREKLDAFVQQGGLVVIFPGEHTDPARWTADKFPRIALRPLVEFPADKRAKVVPVGNLQNPLIATLPGEGLDRVLVSRLFPIEVGSAFPGVEALLSTEGGLPFLVVEQEGRGRVFCFAVSAQAGSATARLSDFSNLPLTPVFLPTLHRIVLSHLVERGLTNSRRAFAPLIIPIQTDLPRVLTPDRRVVPLTAMKSDPAKASFEDTGVAGIYRLTAATPDASLAPGRDTGGAQETSPFASAPILAGPIIGVVNTPPDESELERISESGLHALLPDSRVSIMSAAGDLAAAGQQAAAGEWSFPFAAAALVALLAAVILAWATGRPASALNAREQGDRLSGARR